jgi:hypothetical protein
MMADPSFSRAGTAMARRGLFTPVPWTRRIGPVFWSRGKTGDSSRSSAAIPTPVAPRELTAFSATSSSVWDGTCAHGPWVALEWRAKGQVVINRRLSPIIVLFVLLTAHGFFSSTFAAERESGGRATPFSPPQLVSLEQRYHKDENVSEIDAVDVRDQSVDSPEAVAALEGRLASVLGGKYRLHYYAPFYVIRDDGLPVPVGRCSIDSLSIPISLALEGATFWAAIVAWNEALNDKLADDDLTNMVTWGFGTPWTPPTCLEKKCVTLNFQDSSARDVLLEIMRQAPIVTRYSYYGVNESRYGGRHSVLNLFFHDEHGEEIKYQSPDGTYYYPSEDPAILRFGPDPNIPKGTPKEEKSWHTALRYELNRHFSRKADKNRPKTRSSVEIAREKMTTQFSQNAERIDTLSEAERNKQNALAEEAKRTFQDFFVKNLMSGDYKALDGRLLMDGRPQGKMAGLERWPIVEKYLEELKGTLAEVFKKDAFKIDTVNFDFARMNEHKVLVRLPIEGTEALVTTFLASIKGSEREEYLKNGITIKEDIGLFLLMQKDNDIWYWSPFGW